MGRLDDLMAQCLAAPDCDAPRLVWADAVGGEHGELVVLQCRLASGAVRDRTEWRALKARERELVAANGVACAPRTWLLGVGWTRAPALSMFETPGPRKIRRVDA